MSVKKYPPPIGGGITLFADRQAKLADTAKNERFFSDRLLKISLKGTQSKSQHQNCGKICKFAADNA
jgi:hypothetical protein